MPMTAIRIITATDHPALLLPSLVVLPGVFIIVAMLVLCLRL